MMAAIKAELHGVNYATNNRRILPDGTLALNVT